MVTLEKKKNPPMVKSLPNHLRIQGAQGKKGGTRRWAVKTRGKGESGSPQSTRKNAVGRGLGGGGKGVAITGGKRKWQKREGRGKRSQSKSN